MPDAQPKVTPDTPQVRRAIGPWRLMGTLGSGGMGVVYKAVHADTGAECALKTVRSDAPGLFDAIRREIRVLRRLRHPGVVRVLDDGVDEGVPWYAMEVLSGPTLRTWMAFGRRELLAVDPTLTLATGSETMHVDPGPGPDSGSVTGLPMERLPDVLLIVRRLCDALAFLHGEGVVHRDLKPENVFLRGDRDPVLVDFGLVSRFGGAEVREDLSAGAQREVGTLAYMAPEQIRGELVDARADLYALGCILYELLTGRPPFAGSKARVIWQHLQAEPVHVSDLAPLLPAGLDRLCAGLLAKAPGDRIGYAEDVASALDDLGAPATGAPSTAPREYLYRPALVGRQEPLLRLARQLPDAGAPGRVALIGGESGVGKTRLALELARLAAGKRVRVIRAECLPIRRSSAEGDPLSVAPLQPLRPSLQAVADHCRSAGPEETAAILGPRGPLLAEHEPSLRPLVAGAPPTEPLAQIEAARLRLQRWLAETLSAFAARRPILMILDDLQWADDATLAFLDAVAQQTVTLQGILIVGTWRTEHSEALGPLLGRASVATWNLAALDPDDVRALVADMLAVDVPPEPLVDVLLQTSGGNPFYVGEYLHVAVARGVLARLGGRWQLGAVDRLPDLPTTLPDLLDARYDALDADARALLDAAAVVAVGADAELLREVASLSPEAHLDATRVLLVRKILEETEGGRYRLAHGRIREGAYARLAAETRRAYHTRAATAFEASGTDDWAGLAHHWLQAGDEVRAWPWLHKAGAHAWRAGAPGEARRLLEEAMDVEARCGLADRLPASERAEIDVTHGQVLHAVGDMDGAVEASRRALQRLGQPAPASRIAWAARLLWEGGRQLLGFRRPPVEDEPTRYRFLLAMRAANVIERSRLVAADPLVQLAAGLTATAFADLAGPAAPVARGYTGLAAACGLLGLDTPFQRLLARGREAALRTGIDLQLVALSETFVCSCRGRWARGSEAAAEGIEAARRVGDDYTRTQIQLALTVGHMGRGDLPATLALAREVREQARRSGYGVEEMYGLLAAAGALVDQGNLYEAMALLDEADDLRARVPQEAAATTSLATRGLILVRTGDPRAREMLSETRRRLASESTGNPSYIVPFRRLADASLACGDLETARQAIKGLRRQAWLQPPGRSAVKRFEAGLHRREHRPDRAQALLRQAIEQAVQLSQPLDEALARWDLGHLSHPAEREAQHQRARDVFATLGVLEPPPEIA